MIEKYFLLSGMSPASAVFDPVPSYRGDFVFTIDNLRRNALNKEDFDKFYLDTYAAFLTKIFQTERILDFHVGMISKPNSNNIGRCLRYNKVDFFAEMTSFINQNIDNYGLSENEKSERVKSLISKLKDSNENLNFAYSDALSVRVKKLKNVLDNGFNSEYFESAMKDYEPYKNKMSFDDYIKANYEISSKFQVGMLKLGDFFDKDIDFNKLYSLFSPDTFCLLFAKIIYEFNLMRERDTNHLDNSYSYLCYYQLMINEVIENDDKRYDPKINFQPATGKRYRYSRWNFTKELDELLKRHPEAGSFKLPDSVSDKEKYKDISLMEKLSLLYQDETKLNWEFLPEGKGITKGEITTHRNALVEKKKSKEELIRNVNMRIEILENSGFIGRPIQGINEFSGFYAFIYPNGKIILEKFWNNDLQTTPSYNTATYVMTLDNFIEYSKLSRSELIEIIKSSPNNGIKRIFHTSINNWQRNLYNEINGSYRFEDAIDFINSISKGDKKRD